MTSRRNFIKKTALGLTAIAVNPSKIASHNSIASVRAVKQREKYVSKRLPLNERNFTSDSVENTINRVKPLIKDQKLAWMFENCFPNTLDTTVNFSIRNGRPDTFVITGDIDAMWLRDSSAQVWPY